MIDATEIAQAAAAQLFAMPVGTRVRLTLRSTGSNEHAWEGEITKMSEMGADLVGKRKANRTIMRNINTGVGFFIQMSGHRGTTFAVMAAEVI